MKSYKEIVEEILSKTNIPYDHVFDYEYSPLYDIYNTYFEFYYEALNRNKDFGIEPFLLFFNNNRTINASAGQIDGYYIIQFNSGIIYFLAKTFKENTNLISDTDNDEFIEFEKFLDVPINELMFQNVSHFTFYHELAHLVQKSDFLENILCEFLNKREEYSQQKHLLELDADKFSSICIGTHVIQYLEKLFGEKLTSDKLEKMLILICSSAFFYILSFSSNNSGIYYKEKSHPHPVIRISCIVFTIVSYVLEGLIGKGHKLEIKTNDIINKCILFSLKISREKFPNKHIENYIEIVSSERNHIMEYIKEFDNLQKNDETLASHKWNKRALSLKENK